MSVWHLTDPGDPILWEAVGNAGYTVKRGSNTRNHRKTMTETECMYTEKKGNPKNTQKIPIHNFYHLVFLLFAKF